MGKLDSDLKERWKFKTDQRKRLLGQNIAKWELGFSKDNTFLKKHQMIFRGLLSDRLLIKKWQNRWHHHLKPTRVDERGRKEREIALSGC